MTVGGTRRNLRFQAKQAITRMDSVMFHIQSIDMLAAGRSEHINKTLPAIVEVLDGCKTMLVKFRESL